MGARSFGLLLLVRTSIYGLNVKAPSEELGEETQLEMSVENVQHTKYHGTHQTELAVGHLANVMQGSSLATTLTQRVVWRARQGTSICTCIL